MLMNLLIPSTLKGEQILAEAPGDNGLLSIDDNPILVAVVGSRSDRNSARVSRREDGIRLAVLGDFPDLIVRWLVDDLRLLNKLTDVTIVDSNDKIWRANAVFRFVRKDEYMRRGKELFGSAFPKYLFGIPQPCEIDVRVNRKDEIIFSTGLLNLDASNTQIRVCVARLSLFMLGVAPIPDPRVEGVLSPSLPPFDLEFESPISDFDRSAVSALYSPGMRSGLQYSDAETVLLQNSYLHY